MLFLELEISEVYHQKVDKFGNYNFGITEQIVFPEIDYDKVSSIKGMNLTIVTSAKDSLGTHTLLRAFGFPIENL